MPEWRKYIMELMFVISIFPIMGMIGGFVNAIIYTVNDNPLDNPQMLLQQLWARASLAAGLLLPPFYYRGLKFKFRLKESDRILYQNIALAYDYWIDTLADNYKFLGKVAILIWPYLLVTLIWSLTAVFYYYAMIYWPHPLNETFLEGYKVMTWIPVVIIGIAPAIHNYKVLINYSRYFKKELQDKS